MSFEAQKVGVWLSCGIGGEREDCRALWETVRTSLVQGEPPKGLKHQKWKFPEGESAQGPPSHQLPASKRRKCGCHCVEGIQ